MTRLFVKDLEIGMDIAGEVFLLAQSSLDDTKTGSPYLRATLADRTGRIQARYWDVPTEIVDQLKVGSGVRIDGTVEEYPAGSRQVRIERLAPVEILDFTDFLPTAKRDLAEIRRELRQVCQDVESPHPSRLQPRFDYLVPVFLHQGTLEVLAVLCVQYDVVRELGRQTASTFRFRWNRSIAAHGRVKRIFWTGGNEY